MNLSIKKENNLTYIAISGLAFIIACVLHEVIGHGAACLVSGHDILLLTSVYFKCSSGTVWVDLAGPFVNFIVGGLCYFALLAKNLSSNLRLFILFTIAFNLFWCAGCMFTSAISNKSDFAYLLVLWNFGEDLVERIILFVGGIFIYVFTLRILSRHSDQSTPFLISYISAGVISCIAATFYVGEIIPAIREAALESFGSAVGLLYLHLKFIAVQDNSNYLARKKPYARWLMIFVAVASAFIFSLGRGIVA